MKRLFVIFICIASILLSVAGCKKEEDLKVHYYEFNNYKEIVSVEWKFFKGEVNICNDKKFITNGESCLKIDIKNSYVSGQSAITVGQNQQIMPQFIFQIEDFGNVAMDKIAQVCFDMYNDSDRDLEIVVMIYDRTASNMVFSDAKKVFSGRMNNLSYNIPQLFFNDYQGKITEVIIAVNDENINQGATVYLDNVRLIEKDGETKEIDKTFKENEILFFESTSDMQYVMSKHIPVKYVLYPTITSYVGYHNGNGICDKKALKLSTLGTDGFINSTPDSYKTDEQGCGFIISPKLFNKLPVEECKGIYFDVYNDSSSPRVITVKAEDSTGKKVNYQTTIDAYENKTVKIKSMSSLNLKKITNFEILMDTWNVANRFDVYFSSFGYEV